MFYALQNLRLTTTFQISEPWNCWQDYPNPEHITEKKDLEVWRSAAKTKHAFISGISGVDPRVRISQNSQKKELANPPHAMHAFIADYDAEATPVHVSNITSKPALDGYLPSYIVDSFRPGFKRLVWLFEKPILLGGSQYSAKAFIQKLASEIRASAWLPGFDDHCLDPHMYYAIGENWQEIENSTPIPYHILQAWASVSDANTNFTNETLSPPPIESIAELVSDRFPGRWNGEFALGARGIRFWDPQADNPTAAVVMPEGMRCFTGHSGFVTWREIFGQRAIDDLQGEQEGKLRDTVAFDGRRYWYEHDDEWFDVDKGDFAEYLVSQGMSRKPPKGGGLSKVQQFMNTVRTKYRVDDALPHAFMPPGRIIDNGRPRLNTSKVKAMSPAPPLSDVNADFHEAGKKMFPWLEKYLSHFFVPLRKPMPWVPSDFPQKDIQLYHFLAWHHRFYKSAYMQRPLQGQALIIGGPTTAGKGFLSNGLVGKSVGGHADGSGYMMGQDPWTADVVQAGLMTIDDDHSGDDMRSHRAFTTRLKQIVANTQMTYNKKHGNSGKVSWKGGRVIITCNLDPESLRVLPDMTHSNADKIMLFLARSRPESDPLPDFHTLEDILNRELPHYLRWLLEWKVPKWLLSGDERFWVRAYHHPSLMESASEQGSVVNVLEMLRETYDTMVEADELDVFSNSIIVNSHGGTSLSYEWSGPVRQLYKMMKRMEVSHIEKISFQQMGNMLGVLSSRGFKIKKLKGQNWHIVFDDTLLSNSIVPAEYEAEEEDEKEGQE